MRALMGKICAVNTTLVSAGLWVIGDAVRSWAITACNSRNGGRNGRLLLKSLHVVRFARSTYVLILSLHQALVTFSLH